MKTLVISFLLSAGISIFSSCNILEKASMHGLKSDYYKLKVDNKNTEKVYLDLTDEIVTIYQVEANKPVRTEMMKIPLFASDSLFRDPSMLKKTSLDIDITSVLFKYRPKVNHLPAQLTTDFNAAIYAGLRFDNYSITGSKDPIGKCIHEIKSRGYDFGFFVGPGTTLVGPFSTRDAVSYEYNGMVIQYGIAAFLESNIASFGIAAGFDHLLSPDRNLWIYNKKTWIGFMVGIALN